jgi:hypothetical protein
MHDEISARLDGGARQSLTTRESKVGAMSFIHKHGPATTMQSGDQGSWINGVTVISGMHEHCRHDRLWQ